MKSVCLHGAHTCQKQETRHLQHATNRSCGSHMEHSCLAQIGEHLRFVHAAINQQTMQFTKGAHTCLAQEVEHSRIVHTASHQQVTWKGSTRRLGGRQPGPKPASRIQWQHLLRRRRMPVCLFVHAWMWMCSKRTEACKQNPMAAPVDEEDASVHAVVS
eukprot:scaffold468_cov18-Tisochrysis_lutea.AAC.1